MKNLGFVGLRFKLLFIASENLLMATWLAYLKSKLLLPEDEEDNFKASEVAEKLKIQLKKLELIRLLSDQLLKKKRLGVDVFMRGMSAGIRSSNKSQYDKVSKLTTRVLLTSSFCSGILLTPMIRVTADLETFRGISSL